MMVVIVLKMLCGVPTGVGHGTCDLWWAWRVKIVGGQVRPDVV